MILLAIDPGTERSAWVVVDAHNIRVGLYPIIRDFGICDNPLLSRKLRERDHDGQAVVIEKVEGFGMPAGAELFETVFWSGRFAEACGLPFDRIGRKAVKMHICHSMKAKDGSIRQALIDRFGGSAAKGTRKTPGPLYGVSNDVWSALAVAVTYADTRTNGDT